MAINKDELVPLKDIGKIFEPFFFYLGDRLLLSNAQDGHVYDFSGKGLNSFLFWFLRSVLQFLLDKLLLPSFWERQNCQESISTVSSKTEVEITGFLLITGCLSMTGMTFTLSLIQTRRVILYSTWSWISRANYFATTSVGIFFRLKMIRVYFTTPFLLI